MKIHKSSLIFVTLVLVCSSFREKPVPQLLKGAYGTCNCDSAESPEQLNTLYLNDDQSYSYKQLDKNNELTKFDGNWSIENEKIILSNPKNDLPVPIKWEIDENGKCIKGRKGLAVIRLCHIKSCRDN